MGQLWQKVADDLWVEGEPYARSTSGWKKGSAYYQKNGTVWVKLWEKDVTPPLAPTITSLTYSNTTKYVTIKVKTDSSVDIKSLDVRRSIYAYPTGTTTSSESFPGNTKTVVRDTEYTFNVPFTKTNVTFYYSVFAFDADGNRSVRAIKSIFVPTPVVPTSPPPPDKVVTQPKPGTTTQPTSPAPTVYKAVIKTTGSRSWTSDYDKWYANVYQGGLNDYKGCWFYSTRLTNVTKVARKIRKMTIRITRSSSQNGVPGEANVWLMMHDRTSASGTPSFFPRVKIGTLGRGETHTFAVPQSFWDNLQRQTKWKGFGLRGGNIAYTSPDYLVAYGYGTRSGEIYIEYEK